jgi:hypothetical protein
MRIPTMPLMMAGVVLLGFASTYAHAQDPCSGQSGAGLRPSKTCKESRWNRCARTWSSSGCKPISS